MATLERTRSSKDKTIRSASSTLEQPISPTLSAQSNDEEEEATINTLMHETFNVDDLDMSISGLNMQQVSSDTEPLASQIPDSQPIDSAKMEDSLKISDALSTQEVIQSLESLKEGCLRALDSLIRQIAIDITGQQDVTPPLSPTVLNSTSTDYIKSRSRFSALSTHSAPEVLRLEEISPSTSQSREDLLGSIARHASKIAPSGFLPAMVEVKGDESSSSAVSTLNEIQEKLVAANSSLESNDNFNLACSLAALLNYIYRMLELTQQPYRAVFSEPSSPVTETHSRNSADGNPPATQATSTDEKALYATLQQEVSMFKRRRSSIPFLQDPFDQRVAVWEEIDHLMDAVTKILQEHSNVATTTSPIIMTTTNSSTTTASPPPSYTGVYTGQEQQRQTTDTIDTIDTVTDSKLPLYTKSSVHRSVSSRTVVDNEKMRRDLDNVLSAIERLTRVAPRMNDQRVELTERQARDMAAAAVYNAVQRLSRGRLEDQRAEAPVALTKYETLNTLIEQITKAAGRGMNNQRVELSTTKRKTMDITRIMDRVEKGRLTNQDWHSPEELLVQDMNHLSNQLARTAEEPSYAAQRFVISPFKERDMFMNDVFRRMDKLSERRMNNQDANPPSRKNKSKQTQQRAQQNGMKSGDFSDLEKVLDSLDKVGSPLNDQRATIKPKSWRWSKA
ncbi:hypothetical protein BC937DRAFT_94845 [Endogone sp. FLAS-F59071]|nr:hypothetical protein BC937DRAFT_94845 [Endogone sp. FLAS-F59071]|eukprot:RUS13739.1 hypothetical protein BC937DRAFT_94845 [Endogone sp. FLAS-F59071]